MKQTYTEDQTATIAQTVLDLINPSEAGATILALEGDLGAGKTTLTKAIAEALGIRETVVSPTFVIAKFYETTEKQFAHVVHIDAYRIESLDELNPLGWKEILKQPKTLVIVEWPERIAEALPDHTQRFAIAHEGEKRTISKIS